MKFPDFSALAKSRGRRLAVAGVLALGITLAISSFAASTINPAVGDFEAESMLLPGQGKDGEGAGNCNTARSATVQGTRGDGADWDEAEYISVSDNKRVESSILDAPPAQNFTKAFVTSGFGFNIPANATVTGVTVRIEKLAGPRALMYDRVVRLSTGNAIGSSKAGQGIPAVPDATRPAGQWPRGDSANETYYTYGSASDRWGATLTPAIVNNPAFGVWFEAINTGGFAADGGGARALLDHMLVTVHCQVV